MVVRMVILCPLPPRWSRAERPQVDDSRPLILVGPLGLEPRTLTNDSSSNLRNTPQQSGAESGALSHSTEQADNGSDRTDANGLAALAQAIANLSADDRAKLVDMLTGMKDHT